MLGHGQSFAAILAVCPLLRCAASAAAEELQALLTADAAETQVADRPIVLNLVLKNTGKAPFGFLRAGRPKIRKATGSSPW